MNMKTTLHAILMGILSIEGIELRWTRKPITKEYAVQIDFYRFGEYAVTLQGGEDEQKLINTLAAFCVEMDKLSKS